MHTGTLFLAILFIAAHFSAPTVYLFLLMRRQLIHLQQMEKNKNLNAYRSLHFEGNGCENTTIWRRGIAEGAAELAN